MPRHSRSQSSSQVYHIMFRGNNKRKIFMEDEDKERLIKILYNKKENEAYSIYAYCIMDNHAHLVIKEKKDSLERLTKRIGVSYAGYYNNKHKRVGHVFQDRYRSESIEDDRYLLAVIRYVHQNPEKAGVSPMNQYRWSSYIEYIDAESGIIDADEILKMFSNNRTAAIKEFARFNQKKTDEVFIDINQGKKIDNQNVYDYVEEYLNTRGIRINELKNYNMKSERNELINYLLEESDLSRRQIAAVLDLNREMVRQAALSKEPPL